MAIQFLDNCSLAFFHYLFVGFNEFIPYFQILFFHFYFEERTEVMLAWANA